MMHPEWPSVVLRQPPSLWGDAPALGLVRGRDAWERAPGLCTCPSSEGVTSRMSGAFCLQLRSCSPQGMLRSSLWDRSVQGKFLEEKASELVLRERGIISTCVGVSGWCRGESRLRARPKQNRDRILQGGFSRGRVRWFGWSGPGSGSGRETGKVTLGPQHHVSVPCLLGQHLWPSCSSCLIWVLVLGRVTW